MKLESLARMNGFESSGAHSALFDAELTVKVLGLIKKNQPQTWDTFLRTANKSDTETIFKTEKMFTLAEYHDDRCDSTVARSAPATAARSSISSRRCKRL